MQNKYSPSLNTFFLACFMRRYKQAGTLPSDSIDIPDEMFVKYAGEPPEGMMRVAGKDGLPTWTEIIYSS